jgi:hypothetical protein
MDTKATPGCLRMVFSHDNDGDPRYRIYDDTGCQLATGYTSFLWRNSRIENKGRRHMKRIAKRLAKRPEEMVVDNEKYNRYLEEKVVT